jgi:structural maintenance of chromosome 4
LSKSREDLTKEIEQLERLCEEKLDEQSMIQKNQLEIEREFETEKDRLSEVKRHMKEFKQETDKYKIKKEKIDAELSEHNARCTQLHKNITDKFKAVKKQITELSELIKFDDIEKNLDNDEYMKNISKAEKTKVEENKANEQDMQVDGQENNSPSKFKQEDMEEDKDEEEPEGEGEGDDEGKYKRKRMKTSWLNFLQEDKTPKDFKLKLAECMKLSEDLEEIEEEFKITEAETEKLSANMAVIEDFKKLIKDFKRSNKILIEFKEREKSIMDDLETVKKKKYDKFMKGFNIIKSKLKEMYRFITGEGDAELDLKDTLDPFIEGVIFTVRPPKKSWKQISHLSGGEKTLASLSLIFALHHFKPTPIY